MTTTGRPEFATNDPSQAETVAEAVTAMVNFEQHRPGLSMAIASAYFNVGGWSLLAPALAKVGKVRIMLGAEPPRDTDPVLLRPTTVPRNRAEGAVVGEALQHQEQTLAEERNLTPFTAESKGSVKALIEWLRGGDVEVCRYTKGFLHGKTYMLDQPALGVIAGSSNFTYAGLSQNRELNLGSYSPHTIEDVRAWFERLWDDAESFDLAGFYETQVVPETPWLVFLRMLWEMYGRQIAQDDEATEADPSLRLLMPFQKDGVARARRILERHNGVLIADEVGLGKTFVGGALIKDAARARQRVLIVSPKIIRDSVWRGFYLRNNPEVAGWVDAISYDDLLATPAADGKRWRLNVARDPNEYALVLLDEAHTVRNTDTRTAAALLEILRGNPRKRVVLMTATPVNNALGDLHSLLSYFIVHDDEFTDVGVPSLAAHFKALDKLDPDDLAPEHLFNILDAVAVRRTRRFIRRHYLNQPIDSKGTLLVFPQPIVERVNYLLAPQLATFFDDFAHALGADRGPDEDDPVYDYSIDRSLPREGLSSIDRSRLTLAGYTPSRYRVSPDATKQYELQVAGLLRSGLLKRLESSSYAFAQTCRKMAGTLQRLLELIDTQQVVATGEALRDFMRLDLDDPSDLDSWLDVADYEPLSAYDQEPLRADIQNDIAILRQFADAVTDALPPEQDPKLQALADTLRGIVNKAAEDAALRAASNQVEDPVRRERDDRKVLVFSYFADTVYYLQDNIESILGKHPELAVYRDRLAFVTGSLRRSPGHGVQAGTVDQDTAVAGFAPSTGGPVDTAGNPTAEDRFDLLISSDVLAEGVNLQQARHIVNYDLPWNPMRLVQRHGRIDRIGSQHDYVHLWCFFPEHDLDKLLGLEETLHRKIAKAAKSIGTGTIIPGQVETEDRTFATTREQVTALANEDNTLFLGQISALISGEEFRAMLRSAIENESLERRLEAMPWQIGSGFIAADRQPGFVFCARILNRDEDPVLRYVALPSGSESSSSRDEARAAVESAPGPLLRGVPVTVIDEALIALTAASPPGPDTPAQLPEATVELAYEAWAIAQQDIADAWNRALDPGGQAPIPPVVRQAVQHLRRHSDHRDTTEVDLAIKIFSRPQANRVTAFVRAVMRGESLTDALKTDRLIELIDQLGLAAPVRRATRYAVTPEEVHLVAWMAVTPPA